MSNKKLTDKQQKFLDVLPTVQGDIHEAAKQAGYHPTSVSSVVRSLRSEMLEAAETILASGATRAASQLVRVLESDAPIPQANARMQAAQTILDRVGLGKKDKLDVNIEGTGGLFILPAKGDVIDGEFEVHEERTESPVGLQAP